MVEQADHYISLIHSEIKTLPGNFSKGRSIDEVMEGVRYVKVSDNVVEVLRVLHNRMDIRKRLND